MNKLFKEVSIATNRTFDESLHDALREWLAESDIGAGEYKIIFNVNIGWKKCWPEIDAPVVTKKDLEGYLDQELKDARKKDELKRKAGERFGQRDTSEAVLHCGPCHPVCDRCGSRFISFEK